MRVAVFGGGAVGLGLASCLLAADAPVELYLQVRRPESADALRRHGLRRSGIFGETSVAPDRFGVGTELDDLAAFDPDVVLVCTKNPDRDAAADALGSIWGRLRDPAVVVCLNGWGGAERLAREIPRKRIFNATVTTGFRRTSPTCVDVTVHGDEVHMGSLFGESERELDALCDTLAQGGLPASPTADMASELWAKLLYNCALNPLAALLGVPYGALGENPASRQVIEAIVREVFAVLAATDQGTRWPSADAYLAFFFAELLPPTRSHESSMLQDLRAGRLTEIDALNGAVVDLGRQAGVPTPVNDALTTLVRSLHPGPAAGPGGA